MWLFTGARPAILVAEPTETIHEIRTHQTKLNNARFIDFENKLRRRAQKSQFQT